MSFSGEIFLRTAPTDPPSEKISFFNAIRETGTGVDKTENTRAHKGGGIHGKEKR